MTARVGFIGVGGISVSHLVNLVNLPNAEVVALCDLSSERIEATCESVRQKSANPEALKGYAPYTEYRSMLRNERLDAVYVCLPPFAHGEPEAAVIDAGIPMLVEKPVDLDLAAAARTLSAIRERDLITVAGYQLRYGEHIQKARELLQGRTVGMAICMRYGGTPKVPWYHIQSRSGGQLVEMATHQIDMLRFLLGEIDTVYAAAATRINHKAQPDYDVFDVNCMTLTFASGAVANFSNNMISSHGSPKGPRGVHVFAEEMTLSIGSDLQVLSKDKTSTHTNSVNEMAREDAEFIKAALTGNREGILSDYTNGVQTLAVTLACEHSARTGRPVHLAEFTNSRAPELGHLFIA